MAMTQSPVPHGADGITRVGIGVHDALTAILAERTGYHVLWLGSLGVCSSLGIPDINLLSMAEMATVLRNVRSVTALPVFVDADNGYGSDDAAVRAVLEFARAGATAVCVEDNEFPKRNSLLVDGDRSLMDPDAFAERIQRMVKVRGDMKIIARTEALVAGMGPQEAVRRLERYIAAGADRVFIQANAASAHLLPGVVEQAATLAPTVIAPTALPHYSVRDWARLGVDTIIFANAIVRSVVASVDTMLRTLRDAGVLDAVADDLASLDELFALTGRTELPYRAVAGGRTDGSMW